MGRGEEQEVTPRVSEEARRDRNQSAASQLKNAASAWSRLALTLSVKTGVIVSAGLRGLELTPLSRLCAPALCGPENPKACWVSQYPLGILSGWARSARAPLFHPVGISSQAPAP